MRRRWVPITAALALLLSVTALTACDTDSSEEPGVFLNLLALVPDTPETRARVHLTDLAAVRAFLDAEVPEGEQPDLPEYLDRWSTFALEHDAGDLPFVFPLMMGSTGRARDYGLDAERLLRESIGLELAAAEGWVTADGGTLVDGSRADYELIAILGPYVAAELGTAIEECTMCPSADIDEHAGWRIYAWGGDFQAEPSYRRSPPLFDFDGRGGRLAFRDGSVLRALYTDGIDQMIDAHAGGPSLADDEDFRLAVEGMARLGAMNAHITDQPSLLAREFLARIDEFPDDDQQVLPGRFLDAWTPREGDTLLRPFRLIAAGFAWDGAPVYAVILVHDSPEEAEENARRLPERVATARIGWMSGQITHPDTGEPWTPPDWHEQFDEVRVEVDGRVLLATLHAERFLAGNFQLRTGSQVRSVGITQFSWESIIAIEPLFQTEGLVP